MAVTEIAERGLFVTVPDAVRVEHVAEPKGIAAAGALRRTADERAMADAGLLAHAMSRAGFSQIDLVTMKAPRNATRSLLGAPEIEVAVAPGEDAVVLVETDDGAYHWVLPDDGPGSARRSRPGRRVFDLQVAASAAGDGSRRSLFSAVARDVRNWVLRFVVGKAAEWIDGDGPFGLVPIAGADVTTWRPAAVTPLTAVAGEKPRILLAAHGTFSSTLGFSQLAATPEGRDFLGRCLTRYRKVLGFDHKTLGEPADANARDLMAALEVIAPPEGLIVDAICHSRGGLVLRSAIETVGGGKVRFDKVAFVGCPLAGTHLASPQNWRALTDLYTTLGVAAAKMTAASAPTVSTVTASMTAAIHVVGRFVQALAEAAVDQNGVPGLASMLPSGKLVSDLAGSAQRDTGARYAAISSSFEPRLGSLLSAPLATLKALAADRITDDLFEEANDLVVDTASMTAFAPYALTAGGETALGANGRVYHTVYFAQPDVIQALATWLELPPPAQASRSGGTIDAADRGNFITLDKAAATDPIQGSGGRFPGRFGGKVLGGGDAPDTRSPAEGAPRPAEEPADPAAIPCHFAASMPPSIPLGGEAELRVTLSREAIELVVDAVTRTGQAQVAANVALTVRVVAVAGCAVTRGATADHPVPAANAPIVHLVGIRGVAAGTAKISVEISQRGDALIAFLLEPVVYADPSAEITVAATADVHAAPRGSALVLRIFENAAGNRYALKFIADCYDPEINLEPETGDIQVSIDATTSAIYRDIERFPVDPLDPTGFLDQLTGLGRKLGDRLIPPDIAQAIFTYRDRIVAIQVISGSCRLPWEIVHVRNPDDRRDSVSLAEIGMVRWLPNCPWPGRRLSLGRAAIVRPDYDGRDVRALPGAVREAEAIAKVLKEAEPVPATKSDFEKILDRSGFGVLHFAGHGSSEMQAFGDVVHLLLDRDAADRRQLIGDQAIRDLLETEPDNRLLVFLNACQAGRGARSFTGIDGFAEAFLKPVSRRGAAAFVSSLWSVDDSEATVFAHAFYRTLAGGGCLVDAVREGRRAAREGRDMTWLAYTVYGDPFARAVSEQMS